MVNCDVQALTPQQLWIEAFIRHVVDRTPDASPALLAPCAERLYRHLGSYGPIDVAEAEWDDLPLPGEVERRLARIFHKKRVGSLVLARVVIGT